MGESYKIWLDCMGENYKILQDWNTVNPHFVIRYVKSQNLNCYAKVLIY